ncbi:MAG: PAS domain-containing protein [Pseudomonadaceae bacterium]|nr:PAS domain-containing protein [Pseudomonadaceae bacterium]
MKQQKKLLLDRNGALRLTGVERTFGDDEIIVTKTDLTGHITYANRLFCDLAGYTEAEVLGAPHNIIRHPDMPRGVFKFLWDTIQGGKEIFAYVVNRSSNGDHYWVLAHVTPSFDAFGKINGYHSNRRVAGKQVLNETIIPLYKTLMQEERKHDNPKQAAAAGLALLQEILNQKGVRYDELVFSLLRAA